VHDGGSAGSPVLIRICGTRSQIEVTSTGNQMFIIFSSDPGRELQGFRASFMEGKLPITKQNNFYELNKKDTVTYSKKAYL